MKGSNLIFWPSLILFFSSVLFYIQPDLTFCVQKERDDSLLMVAGHQSLNATKETLSICMHVGYGEVRHRPSPSEAEKCLLYDPPSDYLEVLTQVLIGLPNAGSCSLERGCKPPHLPYRPLLRQFGEDWPPFGYTMVGRERMDNFRSAIAEVNRNNIPGAIVETGVWRGGSMIMAAAAVKESGIERDLYLFDAFEEIDGYGDKTDFLCVKEENVTNSFKQFHLNSSKIHMVKGFFKDTMPLWTNRNDPVAVLRVDGNYYDSYQDVMYAMYENVPVGGIVIFDDVMSHKPVTRFWKDFAEDQGIVEEFNRIDYHSAWFRKVKKVSIDQSKKKQAQDVNKPK